MHRVAEIQCSCYDAVKVERGRPRELDTIISECFVVMIKEKLMKVLKAATYKKDFSYITLPCVSLYACPVEAHKLSRELASRTAV